MPHLFLAVLFFFLSVLKLITFFVALPLLNREDFAQNKRNSWGFISANGPFRMGGERDLFQISCFKAIPINETGDLVTINRKKTEELNIFASVFTGNCSSHISLAPESQSRDWGNEVQPIVG